LSEIFLRNDNKKYVIPEDLFDKAMLGKKLEPFVNLFLDQEFVLHKYLNSKKLISLFNQAEAEDWEFFTTKSLKEILNLTEVKKINVISAIILSKHDRKNVPNNFIENHLNTIVKRLMGIDHFFNRHETAWYSTKIRFDKIPDDADQQQRKSAEKKVKIID